MGCGPTSSQALAPKAVAGLPRCSAPVRAGGQPRAAPAGGAEAWRPCLAFAARAEFGRIQGWQAGRGGAAHMSAVCVRAVAHRDSFVQPQGRRAGDGPPPWFRWCRGLTAEVLNLAARRSLWWRRRWRIGSGCCSAGTSGGRTSTLVRWCRGLMAKVLNLAARCALQRRGPGSSA